RRPLGRGRRGSAGGPPSPGTRDGPARSIRLAAGDGASDGLPQTWVALDVFWGGCPGERPPPNEPDRGGVAQTCPQVSAHRRGPRSRPAPGREAAEALTCPQVSATRGRRRSREGPSPRNPSRATWVCPDRARLDAPRVPAKHIGPPPTIDNRRGARSRNGRRI